ncbi:MAG: TonB-dependent receptor [Burkholderiaceae bacterium]
MLGLAQAGPAATPVQEPKPLPAGPDATQRVEVTGARATDTDERRRSTAAKIVVGRDEIERFGDSSLGDVLKRLPGVTIGGNAGRGGQIRMRGLGNGYTQILLDGERVQGGLSLDSIDPDMVERIEIQRAPTAETGARAIAGTINIITREGFRKRLNDLKLSVGVENGVASPSLSWTREDKWDDLNYNIALNAWSWRREDESLVTTTSPGREQAEAGQSADHRHGLNLNGRLQWPLQDGGALMLMPLLVYSQGGGARSSTVTGEPPPGVEPYDHSSGDAESRFLLTRLNGQWRHRLGEGRMEWRGGVGASQSESRSLRRESEGGAPGVSQDDDTDARERNAHLNAKYSLSLDESSSLVAGAEVDVARRDEASHTVLTQGDGTLLLDDHDDLRASTQRLALYAQDEWTLSPQWSAHAGLRWEGITTEGEGADTLHERNQSSVWTPLLHAVWKPEPKSRDQVRVSLTRSYRSPTLQNLLGRLSYSTRYPTGENTPTSPDRAGNPALRPELASGIDLAYEHYLPGGGMFSANVFYRRVRDLMRTLTTLEDEPGFDQPRWVARPQNVGEATTQGVELEARFKLSELVDDAPPLELRANLSLFRSSVDSVPGPDNRLDSQPGGTANFGADYRWPGLPLTVGGNLNLTPGYTTRLSDAQWQLQSAKRVVDAYALWTINPGMRLRVTASNLLHEDADSSSIVTDETATTVSPTFVNWRVQLELKL